VGLIVAVVCLLGLTVAASAEHILLSLPGVPGEFSQGQYLNFMQCAGLQHNIPGLPAPLALMSGELPELETGAFSYELGEQLLMPGPDWPGVVISKVIDKASAKLFDAAKRGTTFPRMKLALMGIPGEARSLSLNFEEIKLCHYAVMAPGFGDRSAMLPGLDPNKAVEIIYLQPTKVSWSWGMHRGG
jgi:hypothetical protein